MASLLTPNGVYAGGHLSAPGGKKRKLEGDGELVSGLQGGARKKRAVEGFGTDAGLYGITVPDCVIIHMKEVMPDNGVTSTAPKWHIKASSTELIRKVYKVNLLPSLSSLHCIA
jgi:hypothetical protein